MNELPERVPLRFGVWTLVRERRRVWAQSHRTGLLLDGLGLGSLRLERAEGATILLLDGSELPWPRPQGIPAQTSLGQPLAGSGELGAWGWSVESACLVFENRKSDRKVLLAKETDELVVEDRERRHHFPGQAPVDLAADPGGSPAQTCEEKISALSESIGPHEPASPPEPARPETESADPDIELTEPGEARGQSETRPEITLTSRRGTLRFSTTLDLSEQELSLLQLVLESGRLSETDLLQLRGARANNRLEGLKVNLAQHNLPLLQKAEGAFFIDLNLEQLRWTDA